MRRVVITGMGCCTSLGHTAEQITANLQAGFTAFTTSEALPDYAVCPIQDWGQDAALSRFLGWRHRRYLNRGAAFSVLAGLRAAADAGFATDMPPQTTLIAAAGPMLDFNQECGLPPADSDELDALWLLRWLPNTCTSALAQFLGIHGEGLVLGTACAAALQALGEGARRIRLGLADTVLVTGGDSRLSAGAMLGYAKAHALSRGDNPATAMRPFDASRHGFVPGEGGAAFVLETLQAARRRHAPIKAEILGFGASLDGGSLTAPDTSARHAEAAVRKALHDARLSAAAVDWVSAHGTGTLLNDQCEASLLERIFAAADCRPAVTALKSWTGHLSSACGLVELALLLAAARHDLLPPIRNLQKPCSEKLNFVRAARSLPGATGLLENFGFGGQNAALLVRLWQ